MFLGARAKEREREGGGGEKGGGPRRAALSLMNFRLSQARPRLQMAGPRRGRKSGGLEARRRCAEVGEGWFVSSASRGDGSRQQSARWINAGASASALAVPLVR